MEKFKSLALGLVVALFMSYSAVAIYASGFTLSGLVSVSAGVKPSDVTDTWDINITDNTWYYHNSTYFNNNSLINMTFSIDDDYIVSNTTDCNYESDKDLKFQVSVDSFNYYNLFDIPNLYLQEGSNQITVRVKRHPNSCGLTGNYTITGITH